MTWTNFHHRGEILRTVTRTADARRDGILPMDVDGVHQTFGDELALLGALQLRWHTRLSGHLERALLDQPMDLEEAVVTAWQATADELPGTRLVLDHYRTEPLDDAMAVALTTSTAKGLVLLAAMAGRTGARTEDTVAAGLVLEERARATHRPREPETTDASASTLLARIKAHIAA